RRFSPASLASTKFPRRSISSMNCRELRSANFRVTNCATCSPRKSNSSNLYREVVKDQRSSVTSPSSPRKRGPYAAAYLWALCWTAPVVMGPAFAGTTKGSGDDVRKEIALIHSRTGGSDGSQLYQGRNGIP